MSKQKAKAQLQAQIDSGEEVIVNRAVVREEFGGSFYDEVKGLLSAAGYLIVRQGIVEVYRREAA